MIAPLAEPNKSQVSPPTGAPASADAGTKPNPLLRLGIKTAIQLVRYWWVLGTALTIALAAAAVLSGIVSSTVWTAETHLLHTGIPVPPAAERLYLPPDLHTLTTLVHSPEVLSVAAEESGEEISVRTLGGLVTADQPRGTKKLVIKVGHPDREAAITLLGAVSSAFSTHVETLRRSQVRNNLGEIEISLRRNEVRMDQAREQLKTFADTYNVDDVKTELDALDAEINGLEFQLSSQKVTEQALIVQREAIQQQLDDQKKEEELRLESEKEAEAAEESLADNRRRQNRLNELIQEERRLNEIRAKLSAKQAEFDRKLVLFEKGYLSRNDFEAIEAEVKALQSQIVEGDKITTWKAELERIDKIVVPKKAQRRVGSPIIHQTMFKLVEVDLGVLASRESQQQLALSLTEARRRRSQLKRLQGDQAGLIADFQAIADERDTLNSQHSALAAISATGPYEFAVSQQPTTAMLPPSSNRKKLFVVVFAGITGLFTSPILLLAMLTARRPTVAEFAEDQQIPFLTRRPALADLVAERAQTTVRIEGEKWTRTVALRIQQLLPQRGSVISLVPAKRFQYARDIQHIQQIADTLATRDERILIIEFPAADSVALSREDSQAGSQEAPVWTSRIPERLAGSGIRPGIYEFCEDPGLEPRQLIYPLGPSVDLITGGTCLPDRLFSDRLSELLHWARQHYSIVLTYGICLHETTNVEMLARHSQGLVILHDRSDLLSREIEETIHGLRDIEAPLFGLATRVGTERRPRIRFLTGRSRRQAELAALRDRLPDAPLTAPVAFATADSDP